jgi:hypothetical protein
MSLYFKTAFYSYIYENLHTVKKLLIVKLCDLAYVDMARILESELYVYHIYIYTGRTSIIYKTSTILYVDFSKKKPWSKTPHKVEIPSINGKSTLNTRSKILCGAKVGN